MTALATFSDQPEKVGEVGKVGGPQIANNEFIAAVFKNIPRDAYAAACAKPGDPATGGWIARRADDVAEKLTSNDNNYVNCSSFYLGSDGSFKARKNEFAACHFLMLDDLGTKISFDRLLDFKLTWLIETSPGNHQGGVVFTEPILDSDMATRLLNSLIDAGLCDPGAKGPLTRWARLPVSINGKSKYNNQDGEAFECRLLDWNPSATYTPEELLERLQIELLPTVAERKKKIPKLSAAQSNSRDLVPDEVLIPRPTENPVLSALKARGLYKTPLGSGKHDVTCPWVLEHSDQIDSGSAYFEPDDRFPIGGYCCKHSHGDQYRIHQLLEHLSVPSSRARNKPVIKVSAGDLHLVVDAAEKELAQFGRHYQAGGLIVTVVTDPTTGDPAICPVSAPALTKELSVIATWERFDGRMMDWTRTDPPPRHVNVLFDSQTFIHLPPLAGVARQPYFREIDGALITAPGYDDSTKRFGVFRADDFLLQPPTREEAQRALALLEDLLSEFHFVTAHDKSAALAAIFTATVRPSLPTAPAFHVKAPVFGSGKTYLCELIGSFAGPAANAKVSYPLTSEEATKSMLSLLLTCPAVIEFDDMDTDWIPHGTIKRMLTADQITDRILGVSKTATVSTRTLFLGSGNNVGPVRDLLRRVLTIHIDPRCATPATMSYKELPVEKVRRDRGKYVTAVLTIIQAWQQAKQPKMTVDAIATYNGAWSDYCRHPLIWLGLADPATTLLQQVRHDPDADLLLGLINAWQSAFGSTPTTIRKVIEAAKNGMDELNDAIRELPVEDRGDINPSKFGWYLKKNANRIVGNFELQQVKADGRNAWRVVRADLPPPPPSPPSPPLLPSMVKTWQKPEEKVES